MSIFIYKLRKRLIVFCESLDAALFFVFPFNFHFTTSLTIDVLVSAGCLFVWPQLVYLILIAALLAESILIGAEYSLIEYIFHISAKQCGGLPIRFEAVVVDEVLCDFIYVFVL